MSRKHRHSNRNRIFPTLVQAPAVVLRTARAGTAQRAEAARYRALGIHRHTVTTTVDTSLRAMHLMSNVIGHVLGRDPRERDFSPTATYTPRPEPTHEAVPGCMCIECELDRATLSDGWMPLWAREWLESDRGSQADLPEQVG